jgi:hypothetical protein
MNIIVKQIGTFLSKHSTTILTAGACGGVLTTAVLTGKGSIEADRIITGAELENEDVGSELTDLTWRDKIKLTWQCYIPAVISGALTIGAIIGSNRISAQKTAAIAALYGISEKALKEYKEKAAEILGEKKATAIQDEIVKDHVAAIPFDDRYIIDTGNGKTLCVDYFNGRPFYSDMEAIRKAVNDFNKQLLYEDSLSLNEFYYLMGLPPIPLGDKCGWHIETGMMEVSFTATLTQHGEPCMVVKYEVDPLVNF